MMLGMEWRVVCVGTASSAAFQALIGRGGGGSVRGQVQGRGNWSWGCPSPQQLRGLQFDAPPHTSTGPPPLTEGVQQQQ